MEKMEWERREYDPMPAEEVLRRLMGIYQKRDRKDWNGDQLIAYLLWEILHDLHFAGQEVVESVERGEDIRRGFSGSMRCMELHYATLRHCMYRSFLSRKSFDAFASEMPDDKVLLPLEDVEKRLEWLEERGY